MSKKRILFLGGSPFQLAPIRYARDAGHHVITCDYAPENPGHQLADEYHNVSTTDAPAVLALASTLRLDGIVAYASDPAAPTAAWVAERLSLPTNPYETVRIMTEKDRFREFLGARGFPVPKTASFSDYEEAEEALSEFGASTVIKPVDSSGSRGVTILRDRDQFRTAWDHALSYSRLNKVLLEEFVEKDGYQIAGDGFALDGQLVFRSFANEHFDTRCTGIVPIGESFPYVGDATVHDAVHEEIQRALLALGFQFGGLNFDIRIARDGRIFLMEIGPRNGGNLIPEVTRYLTGVDLAKYAVDAALQDDCSSLKLTPADGFYSSYMIHADRDGIYQSLCQSDELKSFIVEQQMMVQPGDPVKLFTGSNCTLGTQILRFPSEETMLQCMDQMDAYQQVIVQ